MHLTSTNGIGMHACFVVLQVPSSMQTENIQMFSVEQVLMNLNEQRKDGFLCDVTLKVEGRSFQAHRNILAAASPYFKVMFGSNFKEKNESVINLEDTIATDVLELILDAIYTSNLHLTTENILEIAMAADFLEMKKILHLCDHFLYEHVTIDTCADYFKFARVLNLDQPAALAKKYILKYFKEVKKTEGFQNLDHRSVLEIVAARDVHISGQEIEIFRSICLWLEDRSLPEKEVDALLTDSNYVRYRSIPKKLLEKEIRPHKLINNEIRRQCIQNALTYHTELYKQPIVALEHEKNLRGITCFVGVGVKLMKYKGENRTTRAKLIFRPLKESDEKCPEIKDVKLNMTLEQLSLCCITYGNSFIFLYGATTGSRKSVFLRYNVSGTWLKLEPPPLKEPVLDAMMACSASLIYFIGGLNSGGNILDHSFQYSIEKNSWKVMPRLPEKLYSAGVCVHSANEKIYIAGGLTGFISNCNTFPSKHFYAFDSKKKAWYIEAEMHYKRAKTSLVEAFGRLYVVSSVRFMSRLPCPPIEEYNIESAQWTVLKLEYELIGQLPERNRSLVVDGEILVVSDYFPARGNWEDNELIQKWDGNKRIRFKELDVDLAVSGFFVFGTMTVPL